MFIALLFFICFRGAESVIYRLNDTQYALMPPLIHLDPYEECQLDVDALYCTAELVLISEQPSSLLDMIKEYSEHQASHYNHTNLHYGICVTQSCKKFYKEKRGDLKLVLEACLNDSFTNKYELQVNVLNNFCKPPGEAGKDIDILDLVIGTVCIVFLVANVIGSLCDNFFEENVKRRVIRLLQCFSLKRNWRKLVTPAAKDRDSRIQRLKVFHGVRTILVFFVIMAHSLFYALLFTDNPKYLEVLYTTELYHMFINGTLIIQIYLMMSGFLLVYLWLLHSEKHQPTWSMLPKHIAVRWLRLTPPYAFLIALTATWFAHLTSGPFWTRYVSVEMNDCRQYWWRHILYINNFFHDSECIGHSWYLAVDTQLYYLAVVIFLACRTACSRIIALSSLFFVGTIIPAVVVYLQDLDGIQMASPEIVLKLFLRDPHYSYVYTQSYCNIPSFVAGMAMGYLVYHWQKQDVDIKQYQTRTYRIMYWSLILLGALCCYSGGIFYHDAPRPSVYVRMAYAALLKPAFSLISAVLMIGMFFKFEDACRNVLGWRGWTVPSRLSYTAYLLHIAVVRTHVSAQTQTIQIGLPSALELGFVIVIETFLAAFVFWMLVEAPLNNIVKKCLSKAMHKLNESTKKNTEEK